MGFNYGKKRYEKEKEFREMAKVCRGDIGENKVYGKVKLMPNEEIVPISEDKIEKICKIFYDELKSDRRYYSHTRSYDSLWLSDVEVTDKARYTLLKKFSEALSITQGEISEWGRLSWIEDIDTPEITAWVKSLPDRDIEFLTLIIVDGMSQTEIAEMWGCSNTSVSKRKKRLKRELAKIIHK